MSDEEIELYDCEDIYDAQISPLMSQIIEICKEHNIPMVATFQYAKHTEEEGSFSNCSTIILTKERAAKKMFRIANEIQASDTVALAETHITNPDGSKEIRIRRI